MLNAENSCGSDSISSNRPKTGRYQKVIYRQRFPVKLAIVIFLQQSVEMKKVCLPHITAQLSVKLCLSVLANHSV